MANRTFYLQNVAPPFTPDTIRGAWDAAIAYARGLGAKSGTADWLMISIESTAADYDDEIVRFVGSPLASDTLFSGTIDGVIGWVEDNAALNAYPHLHVFVLQGQTDTLRGTLLADFIGPDEISTSELGEGFSAVMTDLQAYAGDTPVVEVGIRCHAAATGYTYKVFLGSTNVTDLTDGENPRTHPGWIRLECDFEPYAPILVAPIGGTTIASDTAQTFAHTFSDPNERDTPSAHDLRYRVIGAGFWTTVSCPGPATSHVFAAGTFTDGEDYEWQVRDYDAVGHVGPYCSSGFFSAAATPGAPAITNPSNGATIATATGTVDWTITDQDAYQVRKLGDSGGLPDLGNVILEPVTVEEPFTRSAALTFLTNNQAEHIQVRVYYDDLWSPWASVRVTVAYTAPAMPTVVLASSDALGYISVTATHPAPTGNQPTVISQDIYRSEAGATAIRIAKDLPPAATYYDYKVASGVVYSYFVRAMGSTGTTADSALMT